MQIKIACLGFLLYSASFLAARAQMSKQNPMPVVPSASAPSKVISNEPVRLLIPQPGQHKKPEMDELSRL